ncbi:MAG TPA: hypothetical protein PK331_08020 [Gordonia sp. (in: high G+C Gram-positive bacteria)]|uniref:hypothetical protein n=1 Tax=unclassified Gordonia (in: high G+C Gram-positive bacteria) TaxID=2657482 RepID=UPI000F948ED5|nr:MULTISPECIES: hypothetical protein [unclassified Gordonia (in: high G+C Gram-positive bacteria)]RTL09018.1 MAG: hypothetical protein EKK62_04465 [Acidimicrobiia bacterium]HNP57429.1 hypothetical protein [Gordonia sp. (in: high G+C Gram-positive bacteria)]HRC50852.1 hypothetical protein [Gordonia sp. (in: high G+C Gram-positive bacteria)]
MARTHFTKAGIAAAAVGMAVGVGSLGIGSLTAGAASAEPRYGAPCTNQDGAPGYYVWENDDKTAYNNNLICNITGDAPRVGRKKPPPPPDPFGS